MVLLRSRRTETILNLITGLFTVLVQFITNFFLSPFIVNNLGAEANGFSQLANNFVMYASLLTIAFNSMAARFVSVSYNRGEIEKANRYFSSVFVANIAITIILLPLAIFLVLDLEHVIVIKDAQVLDIKLLFAFVFINFFVNLALSLYSIAMYVKNQVFYTNVFNALRTVLNAILLLVFFKVFSPRIYFISLIALLISLILLPVYRKLQNNLLPDVKYNKKNFSFRYLKELFSSGIWNTINQCGHMLNTGLDLLLSDWFVNPYSMGLLAVSKTIPTAIIHIASTINNNFAPSIVQTWAEEDMSKLIHDLRISMKISTILVAVPVITFCFFGEDFYCLWQPTLDARTLTILSVLGLMAFIPVAGTQTLYNVFTATNHLKVNSITFVITGFLNVAIVYLCLKKYPEYGIYSIAGVSSLLAILRNLIIVLPYEARILKLKWYEFYKDVLWTLLCCIINSAVAMSIILLIHFSGWLGLIVKICITVIVTLLFIYILLLSKNEKSVVINIIKFKKS